MNSLEQSDFSLEQREQSCEAFHKHFMVKIDLLFAHSQFLLKIIVFIVCFPSILNAKNLGFVEAESESLFLKVMWPTDIVYRDDTACFEDFAACK